jgi:hypothetical protein
MVELSVGRWSYLKVCKACKDALLDYTGYLADVDCVSRMCCFYIPDILAVRLPDILAVRRTESTIMLHMGAVDGAPPRSHRTAILGITRPMKQVYQVQSSRLRRDARTIGRCGQSMPWRSDMRSRISWWYDDLEGSMQGFEVFFCNHPALKARLSPTQCV